MMLADFQKKAVDSLTKSFLTLWQTNNYQLPLVFKAPTGAGKTIMMAEFLRTLDGNYHFDDDKAYIWISFGGDDSYLQSKEKLYKYFNNGTDMTLRDKNDLSLKELPKNNIVFINWSKIKSSTKDGKVLRKERFTVNELEERLRGNNIVNLGDVEYAILETSGQVTVIQKPNKRTTTPEDFNIEPDYEGLPYDLVIDGKVLNENLRKIGKNEIWLKKQVEKFNMTPQEALIVTFDGKGQIFCQKKER
jgi:hypothetical protein